MLSIIRSYIDVYHLAEKHLSKQQKKDIQNIKNGTYFDNERNFLSACNNIELNSIITNNNNNEYKFIIKNILNDPDMDFIDQKKKQPLFKNKNPSKQPNINTEIPEQEQPEEETVVNNLPKYKGKNIYTNTDINYWC